MRVGLRIIVCMAVATFALASGACAQERSAAAFWKGVQAHCDATAGKPSSDVGKRIAQSAVDEFSQFSGHQIDVNGRLSAFGLLGAENEKGDGSGNPPKLGQLAWWRVMKYWRSLYPDDAPSKLEVRGYADAAKAANDKDTADLIRTTGERLLKAAENEPDPETREILREMAWRTVALDTPWSAAFISYVLKQAGVAPNAFQFSNAHRAYIYDAFATNAAETNKETADHIYRACPALATRPRAGDLICDHRETAFADVSEPAMRERIRGELAGGTDARTVRKSHCEVVAFVDARKRRMYTIGGNVLQGVTVRALPLRRNLKLAAQKSKCTGRTLPKTAADLPRLNDTCSFNDKKWLALLQLR
jgi:hypothetical protein